METLNNTTTENKIIWTKKLNDFRDYDKQRIYYYRKKVKHDNYDRELLKGYHCVNCKGELTIFNNCGEYGYRYEPYRIHKAFIKSQLVNHPSTWHRGEKLEVDYYNALCCKCWEKTTYPVLTEKTETSETFDMENNKCDCLEYLSEQIKKQEVEIKRDEARLEVFKNVCSKLAQSINFFEEQKKPEEMEMLERYLKDGKGSISNYLTNIADEKEQLKKFNSQVEQVKKLLGKI